MEEDFKSNEIYVHLANRNNSKLIEIINATYDQCEHVLGLIPKEFANYTLHDIKHSIRDINYMTQFVKHNLDAYSDMHLALILIVGLLHDTGMFVSDDEKSEIIKNISSINDNEDTIKDKFQKYIRDRHSQRVRKILESPLHENNSCKFSDLFHIDSYSFSEDIALICQSHTESLTWIKNKIKDNKTIAKYNYNPQQIALLLKIGDNLDIDARRAPYFLMNLLNVKGYSETEWRKHMPITNYDKVAYVDSRFRISFSGETDDPQIYRKVMEHILWLQKTCAEINMISKSYVTPYCFNVDDDFSVDIDTIGFKSTQLGFSLDYESVLRLLMGEKIYGEKRIGLRELLQNSIDAVMVMREQFAGSPTSNYHPTIWIEMNKEANKITVYDNGIGMSSDVLKKYFFNIGKSFYTSDEYRELKLNYSAIGHYGIGFLSCFMLSSNVLLETQAIGFDPIIIEFEESSQFVTEMKNEGCLFDEGHGTRIHLTYNEVIPNAFKNEEDLIEYVKETVISSGYEITIINSSSDRIRIQSEPDPGCSFIKTDNFDIEYSLSTPPKFWEFIEDVWNKKIPLFLITLSSNIPEDLSDICEFIEVENLLDIIDEIEDEGELEDFKKWDCAELYSNICNALFSRYCDWMDLASKIESFYTEKLYEKWSLRQYISNFILSCAYKDGFLYDVVVPFFTDEQYTNMYIEAIRDNDKKKLKVLEKVTGKYIVLGSEQPDNKTLARMANEALLSNQINEYIDESGYFYP